MMILNYFITCVVSIKSNRTLQHAWLDELRCLGTESKLIDCPANAIGVEDCTHTQDVAVVCSSTVTGKSCQSAMIIKLILPETCYREAWNSILT